MNVFVKCPKETNELYPSKAGSCHTGNTYGGFSVRPAKVLFSSVLFLIMLLASAAWGANYTVSPSGSGSADGSDWDNCLSWGSFTPSRGNTYYLMDGSYSSKTFSTSTSGNIPITIKKCGSGDGTCENISGYVPSEHDGQAKISYSLTIATSYWLVDGNGSHTVPSSTSSDYGIKIIGDSVANSFGLLRIGNGSGPVSYVTVRYVHVYNASQGGDCTYNSNTVNARAWPASPNRVDHLKYQYCFFENSGKDGVQCNGVDYGLIEYSWMKNLGMRPACSPDYHGQAIQFFAADYMVFRFNKIENCDGQGIIAASYTNDGFMRIYGNVFFNSTTSNSLVLGPWRGILSLWNGSKENIIIYNNTIVNLGGSYPGTDFAWYTYTDATHTGYAVNHNNLYYNFSSPSVSAAYTHSHDAYGNGSSPGGSNLQSGLSSSIFNDYSNHDFRLASTTDAALTLTAQAWWDAGDDSFFVQLDYAEDMYGNTRGADGTCDRGAFEFVSGSSASLNSPTNLRIIN